MRIMFGRILGELGSKNSPCVHPPSSLSISETTQMLYKCKNDSDCGKFRYCNSTGYCAKMTKQCPNLCSYHGVCKFINSNTGLPISRCEISSTECQAVCQCFLGFGGASCALSAAQLLQKVKLRQQMISSFNNQSTRSNFPQDVLSKASTLLSITQKLDELSPKDVGPILSAVKNILDSASVIGVGYEKLDGLLQSVDNVASVMNNNASTLFLTKILTKYASITASQLLPGQIAVESVSNNFRIFTKCVDGSQPPAINLSVPKSAFEQLVETDKPKSALFFYYNTSNMRP
mmetsp:Transcript_10778/g.14832  ORF Transcript_10778/g.14832 Transcript_10778/m.14832 type:complete len:290 (-) Transcript_10778:15-884(-)